MQNELGDKANKFSKNVLNLGVAKDFFNERVQIQAAVWTKEIFQ